ncbi:hypothetical protein FRB97_006688 [Tulasnella sp. 331]|nr:hypothetical protein FRB97_006688 [Tulasnella sp. 331]KAG8887480.1 hypothetical protein FRB98_009561 [Tulasnella sp. 332]
MRSGVLSAALSVLAITAYGAPSSTAKRSLKITPKVVIISLFPPEAAVWYNISQFNVLAHNITVPGLSPLYPEVHCTESGDVCQVTAGESEINAATSLSALSLSPLFNMTETYFMIAGIAGVNPNYATIGGPALQYEIDAREIPSNFSTGYFPLSTTGPGQYPTSFYGTEVFEVNDALKKKVMAVSLARKATLVDSPIAAAFRQLYPQSVAKAGPAIYECDTATSDNYYHGKLLSDTFSTYATFITNGTAKYCATAQEDNAIAAALLRSAKHGFVDFSRFIIMRSLANFDQQGEGQTATQSLLYTSSGGFPLSLANLFNAGIEVVQDIRQNWSTEYQKGIKPTNYIGDVFGTLGGTPDFGPGGTFSVFKRELPSNKWHLMT